MSAPFSAPSPRLLADYGAEVIKVERPRSGDDTRAWGPPWWGEGEAKAAAYFVCANRGIDIASPQGIAQVQELARDADVLIENYKVGQLAKYGLDTASLQALNPKLIYCAITGYGRPAAHRRFAAARSGAAHSGVDEQSAPDNPPRS